MAFSDNKIEGLFGDLVSIGNSISEFYAGDNKLMIIEQRLIKRLKKSSLIDFSKNNCIDVVYKKNSTGISLEVLLSKIYLECSDDD